MLYKEITEYIRATCDSHIIINQVVIGFEPLHMLSDVEYPLIYIQPSDIIRSDKSITYNYEIFYVDRMGKDRMNILNIIHQSNQVLNDIVNKFIYDSNLEILFDFEFRPYVDTYDQTLCGHQATMSIKDLTLKIDNCVNNFE